MGFANFFDKTTLGVSQILHGVSRTDFEHRLQGLSVCVAVGEDQPPTFELKVCVELITNLLARFYPTISFALPNGYSEIEQSLRKLASEINPAIEFPGSNTANHVLAIGSARSAKAAAYVHVGSEDWTARVSAQRTLYCGGSSNPFGAAAAACLAVANLFRTVFAAELPNSAIDSDSNFSLLGCNSEHQTTLPLPTSQGDLGDIHLVGLGAVGCAAIWCLAKCDWIMGTLHLVDGEEVSLSNLQRYVLCAQADAQEKLKKVEVAARALGSRAPKLTAQAYPDPWGEYLHKRNDWQLACVVAAVDSANARREIQASLPRELFNAWTGSGGDIGISRHTAFGKNACLMCLYMPETGGKNLDQIVAESLNLTQPQQLLGVRKLLHTGEPLNEQAIRQIALLNNVPADDLLPLAGKPLIVFYNEAVCGGLMLRLGAGSALEAEVPMAFQSAMAGVMLAAELVCRAAKVPTAAETTSRFNMLQPIPDILSFNISRDTSGKCICHDPDFLGRYQQKYGLSPRPAALS